jgi:hypothetical protein
MRYVLYCLLFLFFAACQKEIDLTARNAEAKFVIWCYLHEDSIVSASLSKTSPPLSINADRIVKDALVVLYENDRPVDTLKYDSLTVYSSKKRFKPTYPFEQVHVWSHFPYMRE